VNAIGGHLVATASANPISGQIPLHVAFKGTGTGGTPPYSYSWKFGDGTATSTAQYPSHTYTKAGTYTATLTVTDATSPPQSASSSVTITASPIAGTPPGPPTGLTATPGNAQVTLHWTAPTNNGGVNITGYRVYRGTTSGGETLVTTGGCSGLGNVLTCVDTGLTGGRTYYYEVSAVNAIGEGTRSNEVSATPTGTTGPWCTATAAPANDGYPGDYNVVVHSNQPNTQATATDATDTWSQKTNASGYAKILLYHTSPGENITVTVGPATCSTTA
jgi:PKD repeat protein